MKTWERWTFNVLAFVVAASGFAHMWMKYGMGNDDPFAVVNHPWQGAMLSLHVLASPALILMFGIVLNSHVMKKLRVSRPPNRRSGLVSFGTFAAMVVSGYVLQVATAEALLQAFVILHVASGILFTVAYAAHLVISVRLVRAAPRGAMREVA